MNKRILQSLAALALLVSACSVTAPPPPAVTPTGEDRFLIDPRIGFSGTVQPAVEKKFETAWQHFVSGNLTEAQRRIGDIRTRHPQYLPAALAQAAIDIKQGNLDAARAIVQRLEAEDPNYTAAPVYDAEIAIAEKRTRDAYEIYRALSTRPDAPPSAADRVAMLENKLFEELFTAAQTVPDEEAIRLLREALTINPGAVNARVTLAGKLIMQRSFDDARQVLEPIAGTPEGDRPDVQQVLAEIEVGRGQYEDAINRYERLVRREPRYAKRLEDIKEQWSAANMPPQYQRAFESPAIDRSGLAVLMYWKLTSIRFAQNLGAPPIAIDIEGIPGREEIIRAIAVGIYDVDPVTRRVSPLRPVNAGALERIAARLLLSRGADCTRGIPYERDETLRAQKILAACGISDPVATAPPDSPVSGKVAATLLDEVERILR